MLAESRCFACNKETGHIYFEIYTDFDATDWKVLWQRRQNPHAFRGYFGNSSDVKIQDGKIIFSGNIHELVPIKPGENGETIDLLLTNGIEKLLVVFPNEPSEKTIFEEPYKFSRLFNISPRFSSKKHLALNLVPIQIDAKITQFSLKSGVISGMVKQEINDCFVELIFRQKEIYGDYGKSVSHILKCEQNLFEAILDFSRLFPIPEGNSAIWDSFIKVTNGNGSIYIRLQSALAAYDGCWHSGNPRLWIGAKNNNGLSITLGVKKIVVAGKVVQDNENVIFSGSIYEADFKQLQIVSKIRRGIGVGIEYYDECTFPLEFSGNQFFAKINLASLVLNAIEKDTLDIFVRGITENGIKVDMPLTAPDKIKIISPCNKVTLFVNGNSAYSIWVNTDRGAREKTNKIAILGSCFSRNAFNSLDYFTPHYKRTYEIVFTQWHSNLISITSNPVLFDHKRFALQKFSHAELDYLKGDFEKNFFSNLKSANPDYLIIDFYVDACREVIKKSGGGCVTLNYLMPQTSFFRDVTDDEIFGHNEQYIIEWKAAAEKFAEKLLEILSPNKIILNRGRLVKKYKDSEGIAHRFEEEKTIDRNNMVWDKLENFFISLIPGLRIIEMRNSGFHGSFNHPFGNTHAHYESGYYKDFISRLNEIVLIDKNSSK